MASVFMLPDNGHVYVCVCVWRGEGRRNNLFTLLKRLKYGAFLSFPVTMTKWRNRPGKSGSEKLLIETIKAGLKSKTIKPGLKRLIVLV